MYNSLHNIYIGKNMKKFADYTQAVITRYGLRGQNAVARELNITTASMSQFTTGKALPSEETMIKLAELAGMPKEEALIDLNLWRSKNNPELNKVWQHLSKMIGLQIFFIAFSSLFTNAYACYETINGTPIEYILCIV